jgi:hypothetical protein
MLLPEAVLSCYGPGFLAILGSLELFPRTRFVPARGYTANLQADSTPSVSPENSNRNGPAGSSGRFVTTYSLHYSGGPHNSPICPYSESSVINVARTS